jgi:hypothetical protein
MAYLSKHWPKILVALLFAVVAGAPAWIYRDAIFGGEETTVEYAGGKVHMVQADKRAIFVFHQRTNAGFACPEPSPDVRAAVERAVKALNEVQTKMPKDDGSLQLKSSVDATRKVVTDSLMERTQGLQVLRDMLFQACLANVRGDMSGVQYVSFVSATLPKLTTSLIATELVMRQESGAVKLSSADLQTFLNFLVLNSQ